MQDKPDLLIASGFCHPKRLAYGKRHDVVAEELRQQTADDEPILVQIQEFVHHPEQRIVLGDVVSEEFHSRFTLHAWIALTDVTLDVILCTPGESVAIRCAVPRLLVVIPNPSGNHMRASYSALILQGCVLAWFDLGIEQLHQTMNGDMIHHLMQRRFDANQSELVAAWIAALLIVNRIEVELSVFDPPDALFRDPVDARCELFIVHGISIRDDDPMNIIP